MSAQSLPATEAVFDQARRGGAFLILGDVGGGQSGILAAPAALVSPDIVNFMAIHGRGIICLAITPETASRLQLTMQSGRERAGEASPFAVSIEAAQGVTTGISAADRARTISVAVDPDSRPDDIVSPGHVFPVVSTPGGVLARAGFVEAAVDVCTAAGLPPEAVICQVLGEDGDTATPAELERLAGKHGLPMLVLSDLIALRQRTGSIVESAFERLVPTVHGAEFRMIIYRNRLDGSEHIAMIKGRPEPDAPTLVRSHAIDLAADLFGFDNGRRGRIDAAMQALVASPLPGVAIFLRNPRITWASHYAEGIDEPVLTAREYGIGAQILRDIGVRRLVVLTDNPPQVSALAAYDLIVEGSQSF